MSEALTLVEIEVREGTLIFDDGSEAELGLGDAPFVFVLKRGSFRLSRPPGPERLDEMGFDVLGNADSA